MKQINEVKKAQKGNTISFEKLIIMYKVTMYRVAKSMLSRDEDCADAIQEAILKAFQSIHTLREPTYFKTWLIRILINECRQLIRQRKNLIPFEDLVEPYSNDKGYEKIEIEQMLAPLPEEQRQLLKLFHIEDISVVDLALIYGEPENTIKTKLRRARENMRNVLEKHDKEVPEWTNGNKN
ncbi:sigma-70 family RNA polymerase sigma factor [Halalkalibacter okhensis]|uniref:RNA polymerase subunit sigma-24 n=1 Tax=Halalkalibacter okhensis TaxID=333138 RepID=A0A0B0IGE9_9BACI|nr:sigma-70 family RNA polymerase sigma factor [Halalkalibacter okhensis]KHF39927.1 RNA polymerase subunit sigma-24 [Halalkalibacter okhensis]